jgi:hypothetical protein
MKPVDSRASVANTVVVACRLARRAANRTHLLFERAVSLASAPSRRPAEPSSAPVPTPGGLQ